MLYLVRVCARVPTTDIPIGAGDRKPLAVGYGGGFFAVGLLCVFPECIFLQRYGNEHAEVLEFDTPTWAAHWTINRWENKTVQLPPISTAM